MAKKDDKQEPLTLQDYIIARLEQPVLVKGGSFATDPVDGHQLTATEAIAMKMMQNALNGDIKAAQYIQSIQLRAELNRKRKNQ